MSPWRVAALRWAVPVIAVGAASVLRLLLEPWIGPKIPYGLFFLATAAAGLLAGFWQGIAASVLSLFALSWFFLGPGGSFLIEDPEDQAAAALFFLISLVISALAYSVQRARRTADTLEESLRLQAAALEISPSAISLSKTDLNGTIVWVNPAFTRLTGYAPAEVIGKSHRILSSGQQDETFYKDLWDTIARGETWRGELVNRRKEGAFYHEEMVIAPIRDKAGRISHYLAIKQDITARKEAEKALRESEEHLRLVLEASEVGWWEWDFPANTLVGDAKVKNLLGLGPESELSFSKLVEQTKPEDRAQLEERAGALKMRAGDYQADFRARQPDGTWRWVLAKGRSFNGDNGAPVNGLGIVMDINDRKRLEDELRAAVAAAERERQRAEQATQAKDQFLAVLSHELRTPLTPVLAAISLMKRQHALPPKALEHLDLIKRNVSIEARLIDDLLDLTRIVRGKISLEKATIDLRDVMRQVGEVCRPDSETKRLHFSIVAGEAPLILHADPSRLQQVFWNLVKNAIKFTPDGGSVTVGLGSQGGNAIVEVIDNGAGIEPDVLPKLFNAFEQGEERITKQFGGLGLGLAITKRLVVMHGGQVFAESRGKGQGATFRVVLPLIENGQMVEDRTKMAPGTDGAIKILLVEDHGDTAQMMRSLLEASGHKVEVVADAEAALIVASREKFDLLISDLGLPDRSGLELMRELRRSGNRVKAIALSGYGREDDVRKSKEAGFDEHITKPIDFDALEQAVDRVAA